MSGRPGVAYHLWLRIERERVARGWTKTKLSLVAKVSRSTLDNLENSRRAPMVHTVHALADALGIPREEAEVLGGLRRERAAGDPGVVQAIVASAAYSDEEKRLLLDLIETIDRANGRGVGAAPGTAPGSVRPSQTDEPDSRRAM